MKELEEYPTLDELDEYLEHIGTKDQSGRYKRGSGKDPFQHGTDFLNRVEQLKKAGVSFTDDNGRLYTGDAAIAKTMGLKSTGQLRTMVTYYKNEQEAIVIDKIKRMAGRGYSNGEIAQKLGLAGESTVRSKLNSSKAIRHEEAKNTADFLMKKADAKGLIDVGEGVNLQLNITREKLNEALYIAEMHGYNVYTGKLEQVTNKGKFTNTKVLAKPGKEWKEIYEPGAIHSINDMITRDDGKTYEKKFHYPESLDSKRLAIRYAEDGGIKKDGVIEIRRGLDDLNLQGSHYAQCRIMVDNKKYLKGMVVYGDDKDFPKGVDVIFNTNKTKNTSKLDVLKDIKDDPENPFGANVKPIDEGGQYWYKDKNGKKKLGLINKCRDEGDWNEWGKKLPSQFLAKQDKGLIKQQLGKMLDDQRTELEKINKINNPTVKKKLLEEFASDCESKAVHLYGAALPRQRYQVILPINKIKDTEVYAPNFKNGEKVALVRFPHGGRFEIPILTVNNRNAEGNSVLGKNPKDAVGISSNVAERLSGADFDGDTVMVLPITGKHPVKNMKPLPGLEGFDPKINYGTVEKDGKRYNKDGIQVQVMTEQYKQKQMGVVSNLITDMTVAGASSDELAKAVRHSMVVIDAAKHKLDYKQSERDNDISTLRKKYQPDGGASTILSRAKNETVVLKRQGSAHINVKGSPYFDPSKPEGSLVYKTADPKDLYYPVATFNKHKDPKLSTKTLVTIDGKKIEYKLSDKKLADRLEPILKQDKKTGAYYYQSKDGKYKYKTETRKTKVSKMEAADDARDLISKHNAIVENYYANYANDLKQMARDARLTMVNTAKIPYSPTAHKEYGDVVDKFTNELRIANLNKPKERMAQAIAREKMKTILEREPEMSKDSKKKYENRELAKAREMVGASRHKIEVTERDWKAVQKGAITETMLNDVLQYADMDSVRSLATPRPSKEISPVKINRIKAMLANGKSNAEIAESLGVSVSTVMNYI